MVSTSIVLVTGCVVDEGSKLSAPFRSGWRRELVFRRRGVYADGTSAADVYYISPTGVRLRSPKDVARWLSNRWPASGFQRPESPRLAVSDFTFKRRALLFRDKAIAGRQIVRRATRHSGYSQDTATHGIIVVTVDPPLRLSPFPKQ